MAPIPATGEAQFRGVAARHTAAPLGFSRGCYAEVRPR
jgi:hypothetical protein